MVLQVLRRLDYILIYIWYRMRYGITPRQVLFLSDSRNTMTGNFNFIEKALDESYIIKKHLYESSLMKHDKKSICKDMATSQYILIDDFYPIIYPIPLRKQTKLIQVWHAVGAFKTVGFARKQNHDRFSMTHRHYTDTIVSSESIRKDYAKALIGYIEAYKLYTINGGVKLRPGKTVTITRYIKNNIPVFDTDCKMEDSELTEEEKNINTKLKRFAVEINNIRCTILYPGETLSSVSQKYNIPQSKLLEFNEINNENSLNEGDIIFLNKKKSKYKGSQDFYTVKTDETLYEISQKFGIKIADLANMNNINIFTTLERGKRIRLK